MQKNMYRASTQGIHLSLHKGDTMRALILGALLIFNGFGQEQVKIIGEIEFFGYSGVDVQKLKAALPVKEGQQFRIEREGELTKILTDVRDTVQKIAGRSASDVAPVCCNTRGDWMLYIGLSGKAASYRPAPRGSVRLPADFIKMYRRFTDALQQAITRGNAAEDDSKGYSMFVDPSVRKIQFEMRECALRREDLLRDALENSSDVRHRIAAAEILPYAEQTKQQIRALADAARDADGTVRNNATRALGLLVRANPKLADEISPDFFIDLLMSGEWTDVNKAGLLLKAMVSAGNERTLQSLRRKDVRERLIEMARWRTKGYGEVGQYLLGGSAGIPEERVRMLLDSGNIEEIINSIK